MTGIVEGDPENSHEFDGAIAGSAFDVKGYESKSASVEKERNRISSEETVERISDIDQNLYLSQQDTSNRDEGGLDVELTAAGCS